ncbi:MAG: fibronectin type III domain-containing protein [Cyclobacteriaceae bacterium]
MKKTLIILLLLFSVGGYAQVFPVQVSTQLVPPYSPYLSDYAASGAQNLTIHVRVNDATLSNYQCRLRITIEGVGISLRTRQNFTPQPLILEGGGMPQILYGEDLREYFHPDALDFGGFTRSEYEKSARLPEGVYRFIVEVLDYNRGTVVSNKGMAMAWIVLNDPPLLNLPANFSKIKVQDPTNIVFHWTPRHSGSPNAAFTAEYVFRMVEIWPENRNPYDAFLTQPPLYETVTTQNQIVYGPSEPALTGGRKYAWQVEARDTGGKDLFKNKGLSEVFVFQFGDALAVPENLQLRWAKPTTLAIRWGAVKVADAEEVRYRLTYRLRERTPGHRWYETRTKFTDKTLYDLQPDMEYEFKVRTETEVQESEYSETRVFKTLREEKEAFVCRDVEPPPLPDNTLPVFPLNINDTIRAGGYDVLVRDVMEVDGKYFGSGFAIVPWFNAARVRVTFENIRVNDRFWLTNGIIKSVWNGESQFLIEEQKPVLPGNAPQAGELDISVVSSDSLIAIEGTVQETAIATVTKDEAGNIVITTTDGGEQTLDKGVSYAIVDDVGNGYIVDREGNIAKTTSSAARAAAARGSRHYDLTVGFARGHGRYGFDEKRFEALSRYYQQLAGGVYVGWKALSSSAPDAIDSHLRSGETDLRSMRFEAGAIPIIPVSSGAGKVTLNVQGKAAGLEEELLALYKPADSLPDKVAGKINLVTYDPIRYNLVIVPVNGATIPGGLSAYVISGSLNNVFNQAVVEWKVRISERMHVALGETFDEGETGVFSNYTDDMKKVLSAWGRFEENTYYLFLIDEPRNMATLGYMPRGRQAGFVFVAPHQGNAEEFLKTLAHELGHGAFNLKHTFSEHNLPASTTDNLMDYSSGTALYKYQWDHIHQPQGVMGLFEGGEEGMYDLAENEILNWWHDLPPYKKAAEILKEHLESTGVYENVTFKCDDSQCQILADLKIGDDITYSIEISLLSTMSADELIETLMFEYRVDLWEAFNIKAENIWDELYHWWRKQNDDLAQQKGWQVSTLNFLSDVITAPTLVPAVEGWITGKHWRDGHELAGWEQALAALDFLVAEEILKGCITNFIVRVGNKTLNLLSLTEGTKYLLQKSIEKGLKFTVLTNDEVIILTKEGKEIGKISGNTLTIRYSKFGGDIVCRPEKTTTAIGRFFDLVDGDGLKVIKENRLYKYGENPGGVNILDDANWNWEINEKWLRDAVGRGDVIRVISDPSSRINMWVDGVVSGKKTPFGKEVDLLEDLGYTFDMSKFEFVKK